MLSCRPDISSFLSNKLMTTCQDLEGQYTPFLMCQGLSCLCLNSDAATLDLTALGRNSCGKPFGIPSWYSMRDVFYLISSSWSLPDVCAALVTWLPD